MAKKIVSANGTGSLMPAAKSLSGIVPKGRSEDATTLSRQIDQNLKRVYTAALEEEVPDRFLKLLAELRERESRS